ncbi:MAG: TRAP transporter large permease subunit, partial [Longimicrobiales bacterium]
MTANWVAPLMFVAVFSVIFIGYPVAFALGGTALAFAVLGVQLGYFDWHLFYAMPERIFGIMANYVLLAIPFFIFMGIVLERA